MSKEESYKIPMFLGFKTETDNRRLFDFMKEMVGAEKLRFREMNDTFDLTWSGLRAAVLGATKEAGTKVAWLGGDADLLEVKQGKVRASSASGTSAWYNVEPYGLAPRT
jgi:hypothetical protein